MARQSGRRSAPSQSRSASTQAARPPPPQHHQPPPPAHAPQQGAQVPAVPQQGGRSMMGEIASTAAGVAIGSTVGHGLSSMLFGGSSSAVAAPAEPVQQQSFDQRRMGGACEVQAKDFTQCLSATNNDMNACGWYLDQLKACQAAASSF